MNPGTKGGATMNAWSNRCAAGALALALLIALPGIRRKRSRTTTPSPVERW